MSALEEAIPKSKAPLKEEYILNPTLSNFILLDQISKRLGTLVKVEEDNKKLLNAILKEERDGADEGEYLVLSGKVCTDKFTIIDTQISPGHPVKGFFIQNCGPYTIMIAHNAAISSVGPDIMDVNPSNTNRFIPLLAKETTEFSYNRNKIRNIYLLEKEDKSAYRVRLGVAENTHYRIKLFW
jgi:hypothetical protein